MRKRTTALLLGATLCLSFVGTACKEEETKFQLNGVALSNYTIVYDEEDLFAKACADSLYDLLLETTGEKLAIASDTEGAKKNEILIGQTNRNQSVAASQVDVENGEYVLREADGKIVLYADDYMVGGAANHLVNEIIRPAKAEGKTNAVVNVEGTGVFTYEFIDPTSAILMIGDGMGDNHIAWAQQQEIFAKFSASYLPNQGKVTTYSYSVVEGGAAYTDSAAAATALATGHKTTNGMIGMLPTGRSVKNIRELAYEKGAKTAVLTTDAIQGATPGGFTAHAADRNLTSDILKQITALLNEGKINAAQGTLGDGLQAITRETLNDISKGGAKFFAMIEEGYIDKHSHSCDMSSMFKTLNRFHNTIAYVTEFTLMHPGTILLVTADHETGGVTYEDNMYYFTSNNHTNADVSLFALGKYTEALTAEGICDNIDIPKFIAEKVYGETEFGGESIL